MYDGKTIAFITSNTGALFGNNREMLYLWKSGLKEYILKKNSEIVVISLQEFGGKTLLNWNDAKQFFGEIYNTFLEYYPIFISFVDCDWDSEANYTALCTLFLIKSKTCTFEIFDFSKNCYVSFLEGNHIHKITAGVNISVKQKFPINLFPNEKWSRKGYLLNRIRLNKTNHLDIVNLHLIHDSNCFVSVETPTYFVRYRKLQLEYIINKLETIESKSTVFCGDFNFRISLPEVFISYDAKYTIEKDLSDANDQKLHFRNTEGDILASASSKEFHILNSFLPIDEERRVKHKIGDREFEQNNKSLFELPIKFLPTYCYSIMGNGSKYNEKRCPSWCDRIIFKGRIADFLSNKIGYALPIYEALFLDLVIGDHKPVSAIIPIELFLDS